MDDAKMIIVECEYENWRGDGLLIGVFEICWCSSNEMKR